MIKDYKVTVLSDIDYEELIVEIDYQGKFIALLHQEDGVENIKVQFAEKLVDLDLKELVEMLGKAKEKLLPSNEDNCC